MKKISLFLALFYFVSLSAQKGTGFSIEGLEKQRFEAMCKKDIAFLENKSVVPDSYKAIADAVCNIVGYIVVG